MKKRKNALYFRCRKVNWITVKYRHMNRINKWIWVAAMAGISIACQKENVGLYNRGDSMVYFQVQNFSGSNGAEGYTTRTNFSFVDYAAAYTSVVFNAKVKLLGEVKDYDRALKVVVDEEQTTMTSYDAVTNPDGGYMMDFDTLKIKAGSNEGTVGVRFMRNASIKKQVDTLVLKLEANQYFEVLNAYKSSNVWSNTTADTIDGTRYTFLISEIYTQPSRWGDVAADQYFGKWNPVRYAYINASLALRQRIGLGPPAKSAKDGCLFTPGNCSRNCNGEQMKAIRYTMKTALICNCRMLIVWITRMSC